MRKTILIISLVQLLFSCSTIKYKKQGFVSNQDYIKEIQFKYHNGFVLLPVTIQGKEYNFLLDTGAELNLIDPTIVADLNLKKLKNGTISNGDDSEGNIGRVEIAAIDIGGIKFQETVAMIWDISKFSKYISCDKVDGFIGNNLMRKSNWQIDYQRKVIRITDSSKRFDISDNHKKIKLNSGAVGNVYLNLKIGEKHKNFTLDTGFNGFLQTGDTTLLQNAPSILKIGLTGANFSGAKQGATFYKKLETFKISKYTFKSPSYFLVKPGNSSIMGNEFFENYLVTIDWDNDYLILDQNDEIDDLQLPNLYEIGFFPDFEKGIVTVANIYENSRLKGEIKSKTQILKINNLDLVQLAQQDKLCEFWSTGWEALITNDILKIVIDEDGKHRTIEVQKIKDAW
ncbi:retropepsin-like aspartic protease [Maribacter chungangensis]|uniref:Retropepsin-like aspartic protease n=1 Tax=Maribacter chungangensis TaxID=1069117 RepID=A0ABW3B513_9FLAO